MIVKKHLSQGRLVLAACDEDILGNKIEDGDKVLDLSSAFYKGEKTDEKKFIDLARQSYMINAAGKKTVDLLIREKLTTADHIKHIKNIPYIIILFS